MKMKCTFNELMTLKVINPAFEPSIEDYAKALIFSDDYWEGRRRFIVTSKPYLWALALQRVCNRELSDEKLNEVISKAKKMRERKQ
jgi:hypothetical protein